MVSRMPACAAGIALCALVLSAPATLHAQDGYLFSAPQVQLTVRAGPQVPRAQSDLFEDLTTRLTLERADFRGPFIGAEAALLLGRHFALSLGIDLAETVASSEYEHLVGDDGLPIVQTTRLRLVPVAATVRYNPLPRGRSLGQLSWIPARTTPYVGAGGGVTWYRLHQDGEFVNPQTYDIFLDEYETRDHGFTAHALAGLDYWFTPRIGLNLEGRYTRGSAPVGGSYFRFDSMDLSGARAALGLSFRW
jgi:hypothetical protein